MVLSMKSHLKVRKSVIFFNRIAVLGLAERISIKIVNVTNATLSIPRKTTSYKAIAGDHVSRVFCSINSKKFALILKFGWTIGE